MTKRNAIAKRSTKVVRVLTETANKKVLKRQSLRNNELRHATNLRLPLQSKSNEQTL